MKLTPRQVVVIKMLAEGWHLGLSTSGNRYTWLQKDGLGKGGEAKSVHNQTVSSLFRAQLIEPGPYSFPSREWFLSDRGKKAAQKLKEAQ